MAESAAYARRGHAGGVSATTLSADITSGSTTISCASLATWTTVTTNGPGTATIDRGLSTEEVIEFTGVSGNSLTGVTRGVGGTTAAAHTSGAAVEHTSQKRDFDEANYTTAETVGKITTAGDVLVSDGANSLKRLAIGTARQNLGVDAAGTDLAYQASLQSLLTAQGDIVYASAANTPARLAKGTAAQVLQMNAGATAPEWATASSGTSLTTETAALGADVQIVTANTYYDGPSVSLAAGTWLVTANVLIYPGGIFAMTSKLWDGTTVFRSAEDGAVAAASLISQSLTAVVVLGSTTTVKVSSTANTTGSYIKAATVANANGNNATAITAVKVA